MQLHYLFDPLCGWCYGAARLVHTLAERLGPEVPLRLWPGALFPEPMPLQSGKRSYIVSADQRIGAMTRAQFGAAYLARIGDPATPVTLWSLPAIAAIAAVPGARQLDMLEAIQRAHYVQGRDVTEGATLQEIAKALGLDSAVNAAPDVTTFAETLRSPAHQQAVSGWIGEARELMARTGASGFPAFVVEKDGKLMMVDHQSAYGDPEPLAAQLQALAQR